MRANDTFYDFRPGTDFWYLTGDREPGSVLVLYPRTDGHDAVLYRRNGDDKSTQPRLFQDRSGEMWLGPRLTRGEAEATYGVECRDLASLPGDLAAAGEVRVHAPTPSDVPAGLPEKLDAEVGRTLAELRLIKDAWEIDQLADAVAATARGFDDVVRRVLTADAPSERAVEAVFGMRSRLDGNGVGYLTIAAGGPNSTVLHWTRNDRRIGADELLLLDAGVEGNSYYTADVTRTLPASGGFSADQRAVYELVLAAQQAAMAQVRPGRPFRAYHEAAAQVLAHGLHDLGVLPVPAEQSLQPDQQQHRRWTLHGAGHMLGLELHDCAAARGDSYWDGVLSPGHVLTVEPGLYFQPDDMLVPPSLRGMGIRIEDDVVVTDTGHTNMSSNIPSEPSALTEWLSGRPAS